MAKDSSKQPEKISADCPHCGFSQLESTYAKTTFCRNCGQHFSIEKMLAKEAASLKGPSIFEKLSKLVVGEKERTIRCHACAHEQIVSTAAQSSLCPGCGSYMDLRDFKIDGPFGRSIQTQGEVTITSKGDLTSARVCCANAWVEGKMRGTLISTGSVFVKYRGKVLGGVEADTIVVDKKSEIEFMRPVKARNMEIHGRVSGVVRCDGCVRIEKGGVLEGTIYAKSVNFEKGGIFTGELHIGEQLAAQPELLDLPDEHEALRESDAGELPLAEPARKATARRRA